MKNLPEKLKSFKIVPFLKKASIFKMGRASKALIFETKSGGAKVYAFNEPALLDFLSKIDSALVDKFSTEEYHDKSLNPAGWLIDKIESDLPLNPDFVASLQTSIKEAKKKGWIPFDKILQEFRIA